LLHVSQISRERVEKPSDDFSGGQEIPAKITDFNEETHKISLSMKALLPQSQKSRREKEPEADVVSVDIEAEIAKQKEEDAE
ncbi:MAG: S1 RNA-binding domain-containing protein, partial [Lachnospiraceae bacterium]|nr:S1 RNA-binding domain-containing protein [Lachnospiraceae bacterium]